MTIFGYGSVIFDRMIYRDLFLPEKELESPGGSAANVLRALASMGLRTSILTVVGEDDFGKVTLGDLDGWGVEREYAHVISGRCSRSLVFEVAGGRIRPRHDGEQRSRGSGIGDRESGVGSGESKNNSPERPYATLRDYVLSQEECARILETGEWFHFDAATDLSIDLARMARERGKRVSYDCGRPTFRRRREIAELLGYCHVLKVNRHLVRELVGRGEAELLFAKWSNLEYVFVTDGEAGAEVLWRDSDGSSVRKITREAQRVGDFVDPLGAGDAFMAGVIERFQALEYGAGNCEREALAVAALERGMTLGARACSSAGAIGYLRAGGGQA